MLQLCFFLDIMNDQLTWCRTTQHFFCSYCWVQNCKLLELREIVEGYCDSSISSEQFCENQFHCTIAKVAKLGHTIQCATVLLTCGMQPNMSSSLWMALSKLYLWDGTKLISCFIFFYGLRTPFGAWGRVDAEGVQIRLGGELNWVMS
jgi:hypothetical protein